MTFGPCTTQVLGILGLLMLATSGCAPAAFDHAADDPAPHAFPDAVQRFYGQAPDGSLAAVQPRMLPHLVAYYDFERSPREPPDEARDRGLSGTAIRLVNGGGAMRVPDGAHRLSATSLQVRQNSPNLRSNDDWKAGLYAATGVPSLRPFRSARGITVMGWFKLTGEAPSPNSNTVDTRDRYDAVGLAGILSGDSDGHTARALLEVFEVTGELRVVALGRRIDGEASHTYASRAPLKEVLPRDQWVFLAASFDFEAGTMALYRNGEPLPGFYGTTGDPWRVRTDGPHRTSATDPRGIKIGGSFPQNTVERNPCNCRIDSLMFLDEAVGADDVRAQYRLVTTPS